MSELLRKRLYELYAAYAEGRIDEALREFDDSVVMASYAPVDIFTLSRAQAGQGDGRGDHEGFARGLQISRLSAGVHGDRTGGCRRHRAGAPAPALTDRIIQLFIADFIRFQKGRIVDAN